MRPCKPQRDWHPAVSSKDDVPDRQSIVCSPTTMTASLVQLVSAQSPLAPDRGQPGWVSLCWQSIRCLLLLLAICYRHGIAQHSLQQAHTHSPAQGTRPHREPQIGPGCQPQCLCAASDMSLAITACEVNQVQPVMLERGQVLCRLGWAGGAAGSQCSSKRVERAVS